MAVKLGVVGCGYWGPHLIRNFSQIDSTDLCYICDIDEKRMEPIKKTYPSIKVITQYNEMLQDPEVDAIVIALPVAKHYSVAKDALLHNKHVLIEKPMTANIKEAEELIKIAKEKNKVLMVDHLLEYEEAINKIKEIIKSGELGNIYYIRADWLNLGLLQPDVDVIWDLATHVISVINYLFDMEPLSLSADGGAYIRKEIMEIAYIHMKFPKDITAYITVSWLEPKKTKNIIIIGSKKLLVYDLINKEEQIKIYDKGIDLTKNLEDIKEFKINYKYGDIYSPNIKAVEPLKNMCLHFVDCIINKKNPRSGGESGLRVIKILESVEESLKNNGEKIILK
jgi:predicted dehydrogenase